jgi:hypothetical protein
MMLPMTDNDGIVATAEYDNSNELPTKGEELVDSGPIRYGRKGTLFFDDDTGLLLKAPSLA